MQIIQEKLNQTKDQVMNQLNNSNLYKSSIYYLATICAIVVGITQFAIRSFNENNCAERLRNYSLSVVRFVMLILVQVEDKLDTDVPVVEVAQ